MKRVITAVLALSLIVPLASCSMVSGMRGSISGSPAETTSPSPLRASYENALPEVAQLVVGTFKLEGSDLAVDSTQASELLSLWKGYRSLSDNDMTAAQELAAVTTQIVEAMTPEQIQAIADMHLTREDLAALMQEQGIEMGQGQGGGFGELSPEAMATRQAQRDAGGGAPVPGVGGGRGGGGGVPGGGFGGAGGGGQAPSAEQIATLQAQRGGSAGSAVSPALFDALIKLLQGKA